MENQLVMVLKVRKDTPYCGDTAVSGEIVNVATSERTFFSNIGALCDIIERWQSRRR